MVLILLAKIAKMEPNIRAAQLKLDAVGIMVENKYGTQISKPLISAIDTLERAAACCDPIHLTEPKGA